MGQCCAPKGAYSVKGEDVSELEQQMVAEQAELARRAAAAAARELAVRTYVGHLLLKHPTFREELQKALEGEKRGEMAGIRPCRERLGEWCALGDLRVQNPFLLKFRSQLKPEQVEAFDELDLEPEVLSLRLLQVIRRKPYLLFNPETDIGCLMLSQTWTAPMHHDAAMTIMNAAYVGTKRRLI